MREIKFRAWDNLEKRMRKVVSLHWQGDKLVSAKLEGDNEPIPTEGRLVIEQYIDSVDKCGEKIYDGSIVRYSFGRVWRVAWHRSLAQFVYRRRSLGGGLQLNRANGYESKVVGNIHENPELLEEK